MFNELPDVLSVKDVCTALGLGKITVYALLKSKDIKSLPIRGKYPSECPSSFKVCV